MNKYRGSCLCGACKYVVSSESVPQMFLCHCSRCRKETGSVHGSTAFFEGGQLQWEAGKDNCQHFQLEGTRKQRQFCKICGSPMPWVMAETTVVLPVGTLDESAELMPSAHIFYDSRASWEDNLASAKKFSAFPEV